MGDTGMTYYANCLYDCNEIELEKLGIDVPNWIESDIDTSQVGAIVEGGCASGAYMPACTYHSALETMSEYGDEVLDFIAQSCDEVPPPPRGSSWAGMACHYLSSAVELWAVSVAEECIDAYNELQGS